MAHDMRPCNAHPIRARHVTLRVSAKAVAVSLCLALAACGGGGGGGGSASPAPPSGAAASVPAAASASVQGLVNWASGLPHDGTSEPLATDAFTAPVDDGAEPMPIV